MEKNNERHEELEIDLTRLLNSVLKYKFIILTVVITAAILSFAVTKILIKPKYSSTAKVYLISNSQKQVTQQDIMLGNYLVKDYKELIYTRAILEPVISDLGLQESYENLRASITVTTPIETRVVNITAINTNPELASKIANDVKNKSVEKMKEISKLDDISTFEEAVVPNSPSSPNVIKNVALAMVGSFILSVGIIVVKELLDDKLRFADDVEEQLNLTLLGIVPLEEQ